MRVKVGSQVESEQGEVWTVTHVDVTRGLVELENPSGVRFHIPPKALRGHCRKIGWFARVFKKKGRK